MAEYYYDLHLHSCLSPCGDDEMTPANLVGMAKLLGLDVIALTDHNSCRNCPAALHWGEELGVLVLPGMELTTSEDIHVVCLFPEISAALDFERNVTEQRTKTPNRPEIFGHQLVLDEEDRPVEEVPFLLTPATAVGIFEVAEHVRKFGGVCYPAHIDRDAYSALTVLGFLTPDMGFSAVEFSARGWEENVWDRVATLCPEGLRRICSSDAHRLMDMREREHVLTLPELTPDAVLKAIKCKI